MRIGFVVNDIATEQPGYTTTRLAHAAKELGHEAWTLSVGDFAYDRDDKVRAKAKRPSGKQYKNAAAYLEDLQGEKAKTEHIDLGELDVVMLRNDPAEDHERPWAQSAGIIFGDLAASRGAIVLNDPESLAVAINKMYFQSFPEEVRPRTLITRDRSLIKEFVDNEEGDVVMKPLQGSGGRNVFLVRHDDRANLNQMIDAIIRDGYVIVQEYLPEAKKGDVRLFMMNGMPLVDKGKYAAFRRVNHHGDARSNLSAGGSLEKVEIDDRMLRIAEIVRPKLVQDGMFLVGLDIVGDKLMEVNVFSPGGLGSAQKLNGGKFSHVVIEALERKVSYRRHATTKIDNLVLATL
jgi:glutathione synthase